MYLPYHGSFADTESLNFNTDSHEPDDFSNNLFDERMIKSIMMKPTIIPDNKYYELGREKVKLNRRIIVVIGSMQD